MPENTPTSQKDLAAIYHKRFEGREAYRLGVWRTIISKVFSRYFNEESTVLDLGCGYGEFINQISVKKRIGMDLNPDTQQRLDKEVIFLQRDCSMEWPIDDNSLDLVFTSNFFEHLPNKLSLALTLQQALRCLKPGGRLVAMGPNIRFLHGLYWDFWDHYLPLTEASLAEGMSVTGFTIESVTPRFLPYRMTGSFQAPKLFLQCYLQMPFVWPLFGKQFLVVAQKAA